MTDFSKAKFNPQSVYKSPSEVLNDRDLTDAQKIEVLKQWAYDEREMAVAEEENMPRLDKERVSKLAEIEDALIKLNCYDDGAPTKQGG